MTVDAEGLVQEWLKARFPRIGQLAPAIQKLEFRSPSSHPDHPGAMALGLLFEEVESIDEFEYELLAHIRSVHLSDLDSRLGLLIADWDKQRIQPGDKLDSTEYVRRFEYMLELVSLMAEVGDLEQAAVLTEHIRSLAEIGGGLQAYLKGEVLWTQANAFVDEKTFDLSTLETTKFIEWAESHQPDLVPKLRIHLGKRHWTLAESGVETQANLEKAKLLLGAGIEGGALDRDGLVSYIRVLSRLGDYPAAAAWVQQAIQSAKNDGVPVEGLSAREAVGIMMLGSLKSPCEFQNTFGPFSAPLWAEMEHISLAAAWEKVYGEVLRLDDTIQLIDLKATAILLGRVVVYESSPDPVIDEQVDVIWHEFIHSSARSGAVLGSEGHWYTARRDVPTAALHTYLQILLRSDGAGQAPPLPLRLYIEWGQRANANEAPDNLDRHIQAMLDYFDAHGQESSAAYQCAAILAGIIWSKLSHLGAEAIDSYVSHLQMLDHADAIERAMRKVAAEL